MSDKVFIITLNWNGLEFIEDCLRSVLNLDFPVHEVVVVDNCSTDDSVKFIRSTFPTIKIIQNNTNLGYSLGFNKGINYSIGQGADYILIMNNDTVIDKLALRELVDVIKKDTSIGFVSGKVLEYDIPTKIQTMGRKKDSLNLISDTHIGSGEIDEGQYDTVRECDFVDDVFLLVRKEVINKVGAYDPSFFLYYEETDWCARVKESGFKIMLNPFAKIWHKGSLSSGGGMNPVKRFWLSRNQYLFIMKNGKWLNKFYFLSRNIFLILPLLTALYFVKKRFNLISALLKGNFSGLKWILDN